MSTAAWESRIRVELEQVVDEGRWRWPRVFDAWGPAGLLDAEDRQVVSFASNDYLGLSTHPAVVEAAHAALDRWGAGSGASRLVTGTRPVHSELESELAAWKGTEEAVCFPTGFAANVGVLSALAGRDVLVLSDELNHASIVDGCRMARATLAVYHHRDMDHLEDLLSGATARRQPVVVVTDTVFSMDGDLAPLGELVPLCARHDALLVLDEAHAVLGPELPASAETRGAQIVRVGTLSKTLGSLGGFVAGSRDLVALLVNRARPFIFSTAPTPADTAAALAALRVLRSAEGSARRARLAALVERVSRARGSTGTVGSPIVPVVLGSEQRALEASAALLSEGLWVPAIRPPTVPPGTSRLRVTLSAAHRDHDVDHLIASLAGLQCAEPAIP